MTESAQRATIRRRTKRAIAAQQRRADALRLRTVGATYEQVARKLGYASRSGAYKAVQAALDEIPFEAAQEFRKLQIMRFENMLQQFWFTAIDPNHPGQVAAGYAVLRILDGINEAAGFKEKKSERKSHAQRRTSGRSSRRGGTIIDIH